MIFQSSRPCWVFAIDFRKFAGIAAAACLVFFATSCALWDASSGEERRDAGDAISADADISTNDTFEDDASDADDSGQPDAAHDAGDTEDVDTSDSTQTPAPPVITIASVSASGFDVKVIASVSGTELIGAQIDWQHGSTTEFTSVIAQDFDNIEVVYTFTGVELEDDVSISLSATDDFGQTTTESQTLSLSIPTQDLLAAYLLNRPHSSDPVSAPGAHPDSTGAQAEAQSTGWGEVGQSCIHFSTNRHGMSDQAVELNDNFGSSGCVTDSVGYMDIPNFGLPTTFTISMWVLSKQPAGVFLYHGVVNESDTNWLRFYVGNDPQADRGSEGKVAFGMGSRVSGILAESDVPQPQEWTHYALWATTEDNTTIRLYRDGALLSESIGIAIGGKPSATARRWFIGNTTHNKTSDWYMKGKVDDIRFYGRALSEGEIKALAAE